MAAATLKKAYAGITLDIDVDAGIEAGDTQPVCYVTQKGSERK